MKVRAVITIDIDDDEYEAEYGDKPNRDDIRQAIVTVIETDGIIVCDADRIIRAVEVK